MKRSGFTLLELLVTLFIVAMFSALLLNTVRQLNSVAARLTGTVDAHMQATILYTQWQRDFSGAFVPIQAFKKPAPPAVEKKEAVAPAQPEKPNKQEKPAAPAAPASAGPTELKQLFFAKNDEQGNCSVITCITCNPLEVYVKDAVGKPKPRVARVVYRLQQRKDKKDLYTLVRQEGTDLEFAAYDVNKTPGVRQYELLDTVKKLTVTYTYEQEQKQEKGKEKEKPKTVTLKEWKDLADGEKRRALPNRMQVQCILWNEQRQRDYEIAFSIDLPNDVTPPAPKKPVEKKDPIPDWMKPKKDTGKDAHAVAAKNRPVRTPGNVRVAVGADYKDYYYDL